jgi:hypothetical protein
VTIPGGVLPGMVGSAAIGAELSRRRGRLNCRPLSDKALGRTSLPPVRLELADRKTVSFHHERLDHEREVGLWLHESSVCCRALWAVFWMDRCERGSRPGSPPSEDDAAAGSPRAAGTSRDHPGCPQFSPHHDDCAGTSGRGQ